MQSGNEFLIKSETRWPNGPWPSQIPKRCYQVLLLIFGDVMYESWLILLGLLGV
jgi:hypothetical protein